MLSAMASVRMTVGAIAEIGASRMPNHPASPMAVAVEKTMTRTVARVPGMHRSVSAVTRIRTPNMMGMSDVMSCCPASAKAAFSMETPVTAMSSCG